MDVSEEVVAAIQQWARSEALIRAVHIFGSRARGDARPDSDIDVAIEIKSTDEHARQWFWTNGQYWQDDLRERASPLINLHDLAGDQTLIHTSAVAKDGVEIYRTDDPRLYDPAKD